MLDRILDATVVLSFGRQGFARHVGGRPFAGLERMEGQRWLVSGGTSGIGLAATGALLELGAEVDLLCRSPEKAARAYIPEKGPRIWELDVGLVGAVHQWIGKAHRYHGIVHNAGSMPLKRMLNAEGNEETFATMVLGPFALTRGLMDAHKLEEGARVIFVSSGGMYLRKMDLSDLEFARTEYHPYSAYANSKKAQVILTEEWAKRETRLCFSAMHPGWVDTPGVRHSMPWFCRIMSPFLRTPEQGADTIVWLAAVRTPYPSGRFWFDRAPAPANVFRRFCPDPEDGDRLWELCEKAVLL